MKVQVMPSEIGGKLNIPSSKSVGHRVLIAAALSNSPAMISGRLEGEDILATVDCLNSLGAKIEKCDGGFFVNPVDFNKLPTHAVLNARESGSTYRFLTPIAAALGIRADFVLSGRLASRPMDALQDVINANSKGGKLRAGRYEIDGSISSQYITGLLFAAVLTKGRCEIVIKNGLVSSDYIEITLKILADFGITVLREGKVFIIPENQKYRACDYLVEADWSNAAFFACMGALNGKITVLNAEMSSLQGDKAIIQIIEAAGGKVTVGKNGITIEKSALHGIKFSAEDCPDLVPTAAIMLACANGNSQIDGCERLKIKESDRLTEITAQINALGGKASNDGKTLFIEGKNGILDGGTADSVNDHRLAMSAAVAGINSFKGVTISNAEAVRKSYPAFFDDLAKVGGNCVQEF